MRPQLIGIGVLLLLLALGALAGLVLGYRQVAAAAVTVDTADAGRAMFTALVALVLFMAVAGSLVGSVLCWPLVRSGGGGRRPPHRGR